MRNLLYLFVTFLIVGCSAQKNAPAHFIFHSKSKEQKYLKTYNESLKLWPVPFEEKDIKTSFGTAHIIISGPKNGEPLVLLHGMDVSSTMWYPNIKSYSKTYRVYAIDYLMEAGKSVFDGKDRPDNDQLVQWYNEIFDGLKLQNINLLGTSRGGWLATNYAVHSKGRVKKLVLLSPAQTFANISMKPRMKKAANFKLFPNRKRLDNLISALSTHPEKIDTMYKEQMYLGTKYTKTTMDMFNMAPFSDDELASLKMPVLVLVGDQDIICPPDMVGIAKEKLPNVQAGLIEDAGHFLTLDQQVIIDKKVMEFLKG